MISLVTGLPGASKSYMCAQKCVDLLRRNIKWHKKTGKKRVVRSNLVLSEVDPLIKHSLDNGFLEYWEDPEELPGMINCDVIWEEMGAHVDSRSWEQLPLPLRRWLQQHRHRGVEIYGNCQDFSDIDVAVRRLVGSLLYITKIMGSRDPSPTTPPPRFVWGIVYKSYLDPRAYDPDKKLFQGSFGGFELITREGVNLYSMHNDIKPGKYPPLQHRSRSCPDCGFVKVIHV
jgi:hypothetical protein